MSLSALTSLNFDAKTALGMGNIFQLKGEKAGRLNMAVKIRFARFGRKKKPFYRIMATDSKARRDGSHLEILGYYNPLAGDEDNEKRLGLNHERVKYWLSVGAQPSEPVERILRRIGVLPPWEQKGALHGTRPASTPATSDQLKDSETAGDDDDRTSSA